MANELNIALSTGLTVTAQRYQAGAAVESPISLSEVSTSGFYTGNMTGAIGTYQLVFLSGGATVGTGQIVWSGTAEVPVSTFNPAIDTVARVTLTDTATTLTNSPDVPTEAEIATAVWGAATKEITGGTVDTLTNAPSVPSAASIRAEIDSNSTQLAAIKAKTDLLPASPAATGDIPTADISSIKSTTDALNTERLANVATTAIVGNLIAQANS